MSWCTDGNTEAAQIHVRHRIRGRRRSPRSEAARARQKKTLTIEELETDVRQGPRPRAASRRGARHEALERTIAALAISLRAALDQSHAEIENLRDEAAQLALAAAKQDRARSACRRSCRRR